MNKALLLTVPHTGTKFTEGVLGGHGYIRFTLKDNPLNKRKVLFGGHLGTKERFTDAVAAIERAHREDYPVIITMRHPYLVEKSWIGRNKPVARMVGGFKQLDLIYRKHAPIVIPVDSEVRREDCLRELGDSLNLTLKTKWKPVNISQSTHAMKPEDMKPSPAVVELVEHMALMEMYEPKKPAVVRGLMRFFR